MERDVADPPFVFSVAEAAALASVPRSLIRRWVTEGVLRPAAPAKAAGGIDLYSFRDVVGLRTLKTLRDEGVSMQWLKKAAARLRKEHATPWSGLRFWLGERRRPGGRRVYFSGPDGQPIGVDDDQVGIAVALDVIAGRMRTEAAKLRARSPATIGRIEHGVVAGTGVPALAIQQFADAGHDTAAILRQYPALDERDVRAALNQRRSA